MSDLTSDDLLAEYLKVQAQTRRQFVGWGAGGLGALFMNSTMAAPPQPHAVPSALNFARDPATPLSVLPPQFAAKVKRVIYLHMGGSPSQLDLFDYKPVLKRFHGHDCPQSFLAGKRFAFIQGVPKLLGPMFPFHQAGQGGAWISDRLPHLEKQVDDLCFIKSMKTDQFNHAPAQLLVHTGDPRLGHASLGSWITYGLGSENQNLPGFIVLISNGGNTANAGKPLWGSGFLPSVYQGVPCRSAGEPVLYLQNPQGVTRPERRQVLDAVEEINRENFKEFGNPETVTRIAQYEMAFRMQLEASDAMDIKKEPVKVLERYGAEPGKTSYANNCLVARRLAERGVRFIQLYHWGWDSHGTPTDEGVNVGLVKRCKETDQPTAALLTDLKQRGLLEDTLVIWGGEFGRTPMWENRGGQEMEFIGRDHHPSCFTLFLAGGGIKHGISHGETDEMGYSIVRNPVEVRDLHATMLYLLGFDYRKLNYPYQGLDQKLTGVKPARIVSEILA
ncbi:MAG: DUF1501 domain-containing protein [Alphaproteobacteria bacterium]|nr:DUF1501 domain-containing protein [Alphaproteobacteria bacterium]